MNPYGRGISRDLLSATGAEGEESQIPGLTIPEWLVLAGDLRVIQASTSTPNITRRNFSLMQADLEAGALIGDLAALATIGYQNPSSQNFHGEEIFSRRHYVKLDLGGGHSIRVGKFPVPYGINWPDHWMLAKSALSFGEGSEAYQLEVNLPSDPMGGIFYLSVGRFDAPEMRAERAVGARFSYGLGDHAEFYLGGHYGANEDGWRYLGGPGFSIGLAKFVSAFASIDFLHTAESLGLIRTVRLNIEPVRGLHIWWLNEYAKLDFQSAADPAQVNTIGLQIFPRPHWDISAAFQFSKVRTAWILGHFYL